MDSKTTFQELKKLIEEFTQERDWIQFHNPKSISMDIAVEAGELMELFTWVPEKDVWEIARAKEQAVKEELADIFIGAFIFANRCNIDISSAIKNKLQSIKEKYPKDKVKGKYLKYNEY